MKNLKKLNRNDLKTINGGDWISDLESIIGELTPIVDPIVTPINTALCNIQCTVSGVIKVLPCGSTC